MAEKTAERVKITYLGPAHFLEHEGKVYEPGDDVTMTDEQARNLVARGHSLGGFDATRSTESPTGVTPMAEGTAKQQRAVEEYAAKANEDNPIQPGMPADAAVKAQAAQVRTEQRREAAEKKD